MCWRERSGTGEKSERSTRGGGRGEKGGTEGVVVAATLTSSAVRDTAWSAGVRMSPTAFSSSLTWALSTYRPGVPNQQNLPESSDTVR